MRRWSPRSHGSSLRVTGSSEPVVEIDGRPLASELSGDRLPETPGDRHVVVSAPGFITQFRDLRLTAGEESRLDIDLQPVPEPPPVVVLAPPTPRVHSPRVEHARSTTRTLTYVSFGMAGLGLAAGTATGVLWLKARSDIKSACGGLSCSAQSSDEQSRFTTDKHRYDTFGTLSGIGFGVALVGAASGFVLLMSQAKEPADAETKQAGLQLCVAPGLLGVHGAFQ